MARQLLGDQSAEQSAIHSHQIRKILRDQRRGLAGVAGKKKFRLSFAPAQCRRVAAGATRDRGGGIGKSPLANLLDDHANNATFSNRRVTDRR